MHSQNWFPMEFHKMRFPFLVYKTKSVDSKAFHHTKTARNCPIAHCPNLVVQSLGGMGNKIVKSVVGGSCLWNFVIGFGFYRMDEVWKLHSILNEKYGHVIAYQIPSSFLSVEFGSKTPYVTGQICRAF